MAAEDAGLEPHAVVEEVGKGKASEVYPAEECNVANSNGNFGVLRLNDASEKLSGGI